MINEGINGTVKNESGRRIYPVIPLYINGKMRVVVLSPNHVDPPPAAVAPALPSVTAEPEAEKPQVWSKMKTKTLAKVVLEHDYTSTLDVDVCGLANSNNLCYLNSVLQALLHCPQLMALLASVRKHTKLQIGADTPVLDALIAFTTQYEVQARLKQTSSAEHFWRIISEHPNFRHLQKGRQEDAQEFFGYLLETLEQTFDKVLKEEPEAALAEATPEPEEKVADDGWTQVGKHNKTIVERQAGVEAVANNPVAKLFGGKLRNVYTVKDKNPSISVDPFQEVLLEIDQDDILSVQDAINHMVAPEEMSIEKNGKHIPATKMLEFVRTPPILVMYFKRFTFTLRGGEYDFGKITKPISIDPVEVLCNGKRVRYKPKAIIYHHGLSATAGHYTTEVLKDGSWYAIDDDYITALKDKSSGRSAYMAFYELA